MERGCALEKRCPACRFLKLQKNGTSGTKYDLILKEVDTQNLANRIKEDEERRESSIESLEQWETSVSVQKALAVIKKQLKDSSLADLDLSLKLLLRAYEGYTLTELAEEQGVSRARISQRLLAIRKILHHPKIAKQLAEMLAIPYKRFGYSC